MLPLYKKIKDSLLEDIKSNTLHVGDRIPSEWELSRSHKVSRSTVTRALDILGKEGLLSKVPGVGTFVSIRKPASIMKRTGRRVEETTLIERRDVVWDGIKPIKINIRAETTKTDEYSPLGKLDSDLEVFISQAYRESFKHKAPYLFLTKRGKKFNQRRICEYLKDVSEKIIGIKITSHYFRHRYWVECGKSNVPIVDAMAISGNKDPDVVIAFYSHSTSEGLAKVLELTRI